MKVKIGNQIYDSTDIPILLILNKDEIKHMQNMPDNNHKVCLFPDDITDQDIEKFVEIDVENKFY